MWSIIPSLNAIMQSLATAFTEPTFQTQMAIFLGWVLCMGKRTEYRVFETIPADTPVARAKMRARPFASTPTTKLPSGKS